MLQQVELKQRIIGGIVLVSLAVILVPFLMDDPRQEVKLLESNVPAWPDDLPLTTIEIDEKGFSPIRQPAAPSTPAKKEKPAKPNRPATTAESDSPTPPSSSKPAPVPATKPTAARKSGAKYEVQVASYSEKNRKIAERFLKKMKSKGYQVQLRAVTLKGKRWLRLVTTEPLQSKQSAAELKQRIDRDFKADGVRSNVRTLK